MIRSLTAGFLAFYGAFAAAFPRRQNLYHVAADLNAPVGFVDTYDVRNLGNVGIALASEYSTATNVKH